MVSKARKAAQGPKATQVSKDLGVCVCPRLSLTVSSRKRVLFFSSLGMELKDQNDGIITLCFFLTFRDSCAETLWGPLTNSLFMRCRESWMYRLQILRTYFEYTVKSVNILEIVMSHFLFLLLAETQTPIECTPQDQYNPEENVDRT